MVVFGVGLIGCENGKIKALQQEKALLQRRNTQISNELDVARAAQMQAERELLDKDAQLVEAEELLQVAEDRLAEADRGATGPTAGGDWVRTAIGDRITVGSDILFSAGRASLTKSGSAALSAIARDLTTTYAGKQVRVYGFTDSDPIKKTKNLWKDNLDLSANRAMAVARYLISRGVDAANIESVAMGASRPVASNSSSSGKAKNRRVEIYAVH
jgi:outer membrane protein OmpA-like peptidoglycan-associated protein